ncbi:MAG: PAS domain-containing protein, partial [Candidatus Bathyarchaeota archaeon]|nr:PAS domain-containing protein [Candidatus Bathyarchaeota archaeon]
VRTKAVIGRKVQLCHPQKSVHIVKKILEAFKAGKKDVAEFWITMNNRLIHIRYFAVRNKNGKYLGTLEVTQDLTDLKKIEGQNRLLDWQE